MARDKVKLSNKPVEDSQEEMTVVILRIKGGSDTLQRGFDALSNAFAAIGPISPHRRSTAHVQLQTPQNGTALELEAHDDENAEEVAQACVEDDGDHQRSSGQRKYTVQTLVSDLDLTAGGQGWKAFAVDKAPQNDNEKYLVAAIWLTESAGLETFTTDHIFTCFRAMGWKEQKDFSQPLRLMKSKKSYFENPSRGVWKLTTSIGVPAAQKIDNGADKE
jgi:hypothetical protein